MTMGRLKAVDAAVPPTGGTTVAKNNLSSAISNISAAVEQIGKLGRNEHFGYNYIRAPDLIKALAPLMHQYNIIITQSETACEMMNPEVLKCSYEFTIEHTVSGETKTIKSSGMAKVSGTKQGFNDKAPAAIATTVRKYVLIGLFNVVVDDMPDVDADNTKKPKTLSTQQQAVLFTKLMAEYDQITNVGDLHEWGEIHAMEVVSLTAAQQQALRFRYKERLDQLRPPTGKPLTIVPAPKARLQPDKPKGTLSDQALVRRANRIRAQQQAGAYEAPIDDKNPY